MQTNLVADKSFLQVFLVLGKVLLELFVVLRVEAALLQAACSPRGNISFPSLEHHKGGVHLCGRSSDRSGDRSCANKIYMNVTMTC